MSWAVRFARAFRSALERRVLGLSADEIRYTIDDVRAEIRATRTELLAEIAGLRAEIEQLAGRPRSDLGRDPDEARPHDA